MRHRFPKHITVLIDKREQKKVVFPSAFKWWSRDRVPRMMSVRQELVKLPTADYALKGCESTVLIERKGAWTEVDGNLLSADRARFVSVMDRMVDECDYPTFLIEMTRGDAFRPITPYLTEPLRTIDYLLREALRRHIHVLWWPPPGRYQPWQGGELILRWMWQCVYVDRYLGGLPCMKNCKLSYKQLLTSACRLVSEAESKKAAPKRRPRSRSR